MAARKSRSHLMELAKRGAQAQLDDLLHEVQMLIELFPHLRDSLDRDELPLGFLMRKGARGAAKRAGDASPSPQARTAASGSKRRPPAYNAAKKSGPKSR